MTTIITKLKIAATSATIFLALYNKYEAPKGIELASVSGYRYILPGPPTCEFKMMCSTIPADLCKFGTVYLWGMNGQYQCNVPVYKLQ